MAKRNPGTPHRYVEGNAERTQERIEQYHALNALLQTWESTPEKVQVRNHDYIIKLRARVRNVRAYIEHRACPASDLG
jgi:hypothetical protein